jgi:hypothetical protein
LALLAARHAGYGSGGRSGAAGGPAGFRKR